MKDEYGSVKIVLKSRGMLYRQCAVESVSTMLRDSTLSKLSAMRNHRFIGLLTADSAFQRL